MVFPKTFCSEFEQIKVMHVALFGYVIVVAILYILYKSSLDPFSPWSLISSDGEGTRNNTHFASQLVQSYDNETKNVKPICDFTSRKGDICLMDGDVRILGNSSTIFFCSADDSQINKVWNIRPYPRKYDDVAMKLVTNFTIKTSSKASHEIPNCTTSHKIPAIIFSTAGYSGNDFHAFSDILVPLFQTAREFRGQVQLLVANQYRLWNWRYEEILRNLSGYALLDIDKTNEVLCYPKMIIGLKFTKEFSINTSKSSYSMKDFREFIREAHSLRRDSIFTRSLIKHGGADDQGELRPRLLMITRASTRSLLNKQEIADMAENLGFETSMKDFYGMLTKDIAKLVNKFDVLMGVHGSELTNMVFLPEKAVVIQIVGIGLKGLSRKDFEWPARDMGLRYLKYMINANESTLSQKYDAESVIMRRPLLIAAQGWPDFKKIYMIGQNVTIDVSRLRIILRKTLEMLKES